MAAAVALGVVYLLLYPDSPLPPVPAVARLFFLVTGVGYLSAGLIADARRGVHGRTGVLLCAAGLVWLAYGLRRSTDAAVYTLSLLLLNQWLPVVAHVALAFPTGRLGGRRRALVVAGYVLAGLSGVWTGLSNGPPAGCGPRCPRNLLLVRPLSGAEAVSGVLRWAGLGVAVAVLGVLAVDFVRASGPARRVHAPLLAGAVVLGGWYLARQLQVDQGWVNGLAPAAMPAGFLAAVIRARYARAAVADLVVAITPAADGAELQAALRRLLKDPTLTVLRPAEAGGWTTVAAQPAALPPQALVVADHTGRAVAAVAHDPALVEQPELLDAVRAAVLLAVENDRLATAVAGQVAELRESRARIVTAADTARRRIERNLHDGAQQQLISAALSLHRAGQHLTAEADSQARELLDDSAAQLTAALDQLRELARGLHPPILNEAGLRPAVESLLARSAVPATLHAAPAGRLPPEEEATAYYVIAEALTNIDRHAAASHTQVDLRQTGDALHISVTDDGCGGAQPATGTGLAGLADRLAACGGRLDIHSPPGGGTRISAVIPHRPADR